jgi:parallel beta-helix repeat protein
MKTYHKFNPSRFCRRVVGRGLNIGLLLLSVFWLTWTVAHAQPMLLDPELLPQPEVVQPAAPEAPIVREGTPQPRRGTPAPDAPSRRPWVELAPQWPAVPGIASLPDERIGPAGPAAPLAGTLTVNSTADTSLVDSVLTLREALLVANGTITGPFTVAEQGQMSGCTFTTIGGFQYITGGCGAGIQDNIFFAPALGFRPVITLSSPLPPISDTRATNIIGAFLFNNVQPVINAQNIGTGQDGLVVTSDNNGIFSISVINAPRDGIVLSGNQNTVSTWTMARNNGGSGIYVTGLTNTVSNSYIGVFSNTVTNSFDCAGNAQEGIYLASTARATTVRKNRIGCNGLGGISVVNSSDNLIGGSTHITDGNSIYYNNFEGIYLAGSNARRNVIQANDIYSNSMGLRINASQQNTITAGLSPLQDYNAIFDNASDGVRFESGAQNNLLASAWAYGNGRHGVNLIGANTQFNVISRTEIFGNARDGIRQDNNAGANIWREMSIYDNGGLGIDTNAPDDASNTPNPPYFFITSVNQNTGLVQGKANGTAFLVITTVDLYRIDLDPSGFGEGYQFVGSDTTDSNGNWSITDPNPSLSRGCYTAVVRGLAFLVPYATEFTRSNCSAFAPIVRRP